MDSQLLKFQLSFWFLSCSFLMVMHFKLKIHHFMPLMKLKIISFNLKKVSWLVFFFFFSIIIAISHQFRLKCKVLPDQNLTLVNSFSNSVSLNNDCNWTQNQNHLVHKQTLNHLDGWVFVYELSSSGFDSSCSHLNSDFAPASRKEFLDTQGTIECGFPLKRVCDMTRTYSQTK